MKVRGIIYRLTCAGLALGLAGIANAGAHTWVVKEVFSNADGTVQFVELFNNGGAGENGVVSQTLSSNANSFTIGGSAPGDTTAKHYLIATPAFAVLPGAPTPDVVIPMGSYPFFFATAGDTVAYGGFDSWNFGAVPTDGVQSLDRASGLPATNSPTNYAGTSGSVDASPSTSVPAQSLWGAFLVVGLLLSTGTWLSRQRSNTA